MKCEKDNYGKCKETCKFWLKHLENSNKHYVCLTVPHGLYDYDTILINADKNKELLSVFDEY